MSKEEVIQKMVEGQRSHINWHSKQTERLSVGADFFENVGDIEHHEKWIEIYNWALYYLTREQEK